MKGLVAVVAVALAASGAAFADKAPTPKQFGIAMQAAGQCKGLQMRIDTERKVNSSRSIPIRDADGYMDGLYYAMDNPDTICNQAWVEFGCGGSKVDALLQNSAQTGASRKTCEY